MAKFLTQSRKDAKAQRVFSFLASLHGYSGELRIFGKIFFSLRALRLCAIQGPGGIWLRRQPRRAFASLR